MYVPLQPNTKSYMYTSVLSQNGHIETRKVAKLALSADGLIVAQAYLLKGSIVLESMNCIANINTGNK